MNDKKIDFFKGVKIKRVTWHQITAICIGIIILGGLAFFATVLFGETERQKFETSAYIAYTTKQDILESYKELSEKDSKTKDYNAFTTLSDAVKAIKDKKAVFDGKTYNDIVGFMPDGVQLISIEFYDSSVTIACKCTDISSASEFARELDKSGAFKKIEYDGITKESDGSYSFSVICY